MNWDDRIVLLSVNPDIATPEEVARLAGDLMEARSLLNYFLGSTEESTENLIERLNEFTRSDD